MVVLSHLNATQSYYHIYRDNWGIHLVIQVIFFFTERKLLVRKDTKVATTTDKYGKHLKIMQWLYFVILMWFLKSNIIFIHLLFCSFCRSENKQRTAWGKQRQVIEISHTSLRWTSLYLLNIHVHLYSISLLKGYSILVSSSIRWHR